MRANSRTPSCSSRCCPKGSSITASFMNDHRGKMSERSKACGDNALHHQLMSPAPARLPPAKAIVRFTISRGLRTKAPIDHHGGRQIQPFSHWLDLRRSDLHAFDVRAASDFGRQATWRKGIQKRPTPDARRPSAFRECPIMTVHPLPVRSEYRRHL